MSMGISSILHSITVSLTCFKIIKLCFKTCSATGICKYWLKYRTSLKHIISALFQNKRGQDKEEASNAINSDWDDNHHSSSSMSTMSTMAKMQAQIAASSASGSHQLPPSSPSLPPVMQNSTPPPPQHQPSPPSVMQDHTLPPPHVCWPPPPPAMKDHAPPPPPIVQKTPACPLTHQLSRTSSAVVTLQHMSHRSSALTNLSPGSPLTSLSESHF